MLLEAMDLSKPKKRNGFPEGPLKVGYVSESSLSKDPSKLAQMDKMKDCHIVFFDKITFKSGIESPRSGYRNLRDFLREGDTLVIYDFDKLADSLSEVIDELLDLITMRCNLIVLKEGIDTSLNGTGLILEKLIFGLAGVMEAECGKEVLLRNGHTERHPAFWGAQIPPR